MNEFPKTRQSLGHIEARPERPPFVRRAEITATLLACVVGSPAVVEAAPPAASEPEPITLICDTNVLEPEAGARLQRRLVEQLEPALEREGMRVVGASEPSRQIVRVHVLAFDEQQRDYGLRLEASADAELRISSLRCEGCSEDELVAVVGDSVAQLLGPSAAIEPAPATSAAPSEPIEPAPERGLAGLGIAGAVLLATGVGACATGTYLMVHGVERPADHHGTRLEATDFRPAGAITLVLGATATTVGAALLAFDLQRRKRHRGLALHVTPTYLGIQLTRRF